MFLTFSFFFHDVFAPEIECSIDDNAMILSYKLQTKTSKIQLKISDKKLKKGDENNQSCLNILQGNNLSTWLIKMNS